MSSDEAGHDEGRPLLLRFPNDSSAIRDSRIALVQFLKPVGVSPQTLHRTELILEELVSNIVRHGCDATEVSVGASVCDQAVKLVVEDDGQPFNPFTRPDPQPFTTVEEAQLGGLGIMLVRKFSQSTDYERVGERNRVSVSVANE